MRLSNNVPLATTGLSPRIEDDERRLRELERDNELTQMAIPGEPED